MTEAATDVGARPDDKKSPPGEQKAQKTVAELEKELRRVERGKYLRPVLVLLLLGALVGGYFFWRNKTKPPPAARYVTAATTQGDVLEVVQSTGQVKPVTEVQVGAQVSGRVTKVHVDFNSLVKKGDLLAEIDPSIFGAQMDSTEAQIAGARANVARAEANMVSAKLRLERAKKLLAESVGTQAELEAAQAAYDTAVADVAASKASVNQFSAQLKTSRTNIAYTRIESPIDGVVVTRSIEPGQTVAASFQSPVLFTLAQGLTNMRVLADIDEADVGRLKEGMGAEVTVDAFPGESFQGKVTQVRFSPQVVSGVVTYAAVVDVANPELKLRPGMTATVTIRTSEAKGVARVPNSALRFKPNAKLDKEGKPIPEPPQPKLPPGKGRVYVLIDATPGQEKLEPRIVDVGITDGVNTVLKGSLDGEKLAVDEIDEAKGGGQRRGPRLF